jgi:TIGR00255 family protein
MLYSMTGFGKATAEIPGKKITVEIKSLNSKQIDIAARIPGAYKEYELEIRNIISQRLERGKVDLMVSVENIAETSASRINIPVMAAYKAQIEEMSAALSIPLPADWYAALLRLPDVMKADVQSTVDEKESEALFKAVTDAVDALMAYRRTEGVKLEDFFTKRIDNIAALLAEVPRFEVERVAKIRARLTDSMEKFLTVEFDKSRLEQEMFFYIEKLDINEEKQRLAQHLAYFRETIAAQAGQGKKLGFISQEMGREINTLGSKSNHAEMQRLVVRMKDELEQIKEQVLNVM